MFTPSTWSGDKRDSQIRRDRITLVLLAIALIAVLAIMAWLSSLGVVPNGGGYEAWMM